MRSGRWHSIIAAMYRAAFRPTVTGTDSPITRRSKRYNLSRPHGEERCAAARLEPWAASILRDASLRGAPQDEAERDTACDKLCTVISGLDATCAANAGALPLP